MNAIEPDARVPIRRGQPPRTTGIEIPHDQLDQSSPPEIRARLLARYI